VKLYHRLSLFAAALLTACSGGSGSAPAVLSPPQSQSGGTGAASSSSFTYDTSALKGATFVGSAVNLSSISVDLVPKMQNASGLLQYARSVNDPHSGSFRQFLTPQQIGQQYGASESTYAGAVKYFQSAGLSVATWPQRLLLHVTGPQTKMEAALHTHFGWYRNGTSIFLAPSTAPAPPSSAGVVGAANIVMTPMVSTAFVSVSGGVGNGIAQGYSPQQIATAFDYNGAYAAGYTGAGITTGIIGTAGVTSSDVPAYKKLFGIGGSGTMTVVSATDANAPGNAALGFASPPPVTRNCNDPTRTDPLPASISPTPNCNPEDLEAQLDTEQLSALAPDANLRFYLAYNPDDGCGNIGTTCPAGAGLPLQGLGEVDAELQTAIADDRADVLSLSFGGPEPLQVGTYFNASGEGIEPVEFAALASEGIAIFVSSGDSGAEGCQRYDTPDHNAPCVQYPSTDPNVVSVGGVNTPLDSAGRFLGALTAWGSRTSYNALAGSGGGISAYFPQALYQQGAAGITGSMRNVPDMSLEADAATGVSVVTNAAFSNENIEGVGGTSVAAPESAAMWALVLQACKQTSSCAGAGGPFPYRLGNPNAYFYKIYQNATTYTHTFYDVLYGDNTTPCAIYEPAPPTQTPCPSPSDPGYAAMKGYDRVTGIGVPFARALIKGVVGK
jgi:subtilase family serine protease